MFNTHYLLLFLVLVSSGGSAQIIHPTAHAHNDYEHPRPLLDALQNGFISVEADIHLIKGELYVSHNRPRPAAAFTLETLYLKPLDSLCKLDVSVYKDYGKPIILLIDVKTNAATTFEKLIAELKQHPSLSPPGTDGSCVQIVISGNRDYELILRNDAVSIDGRPADLGKGFLGTKMPIISDHFGNWMRWNGQGTPDATEVQRIRDLARRVHNENKMLRLWAIPDREEAWQVLLDAGVDLINTDRLEALNQFLTKKASERKRE